MRPDISALYPPPPPPRAGHQGALESELLRRFDARPASVHRGWHKGPSRRLGLGLSLLAGLAAASQAPVERAVAVGHHFLVTLPLGAPLPPLDAFGSAFRGARPTAFVKQEFRAEDFSRPGQARQLTLEADVWNDVPPAETEARLKALPALAGATVVVTPLKAQLRQTLATRLGEELFNLPADRASVEAARKRLQAALGAEGEGGQVELEVDGPESGQRRVRVKVTPSGVQEDGAGPPLGR
jgi:hypothetical protein